jgi:hypothetical protein
MKILNTAFIYDPFKYLCKIFKSMIIIIIMAATDTATAAAAAAAAATATATTTITNGDDYLCRVDSTKLFGLKDFSY